MSVVAEQKARYSPVEAWVYDRYIAPAVMDVHWIVPRFREMGAPAEGERFLDVGCGGGLAAIRFAKVFPQVRVDGVDVSPHQIERARKRSRGLDRLAFQCAPAEELPFPDATFDRVYSMVSIKHWSDPDAGLRECVRVLKPGGWLLIAEADRACRLDDVRTFIGRTRFPSFLKPMWLPIFRTFVAGQSFVAEEIEERFWRLPVHDVRIEYLPKTPAFALIARKNA